MFKFQSLASALCFLAVSVSATPQRRFRELMNRGRKTALSAVCPGNVYKGFIR
jgi:hypothetical protein